MSRQCSGFKRNGERCTATVEPPQTHCWWHDPANANQRSRAASRAARSKGNQELAAVRRQLQGIADRCLSGNLEPKRATAAVQALQALIRAHEVERRVKELEEVEEQLAALETRAQGGR